MEQYISKAAVVAEIEKRIADNKKEIERASHKNLEDYFEGYEDALTLFKEQFLNTLEVKEVDLEKEYERYYEQERNIQTFKLAKHFFELGLNSQTKDMQEALRMEYEKGRADVLRCIDPDEMVADFCSQPLSKTRSLASIYRQGIIDIIKRINRNEETSITGTRSIDDGGVY